MMEVAAREKVVTQMGTQIHAGDNYRRVVEVVQAGQKQGINAPLPVALSKVPRCHGQDIKSIQCLEELHHESGRLS